MDHIKNRGNHGCENWELERVGFLPGKRESVRYVGEHILTQNDIESGGRFPDVAAYGGWPMDDHNPKGFKANSSEDKASVMYPAPPPYGIPLRCLYSVNVENLFFRRQKYQRNPCGNEFNACYGHLLTFGSGCRHCGISLR